MTRRMTWIVLALVGVMVLVVTQAKTGSTFTITKASTGAVTRTCTQPGQKGCPSGTKGW